MSSGDSLERWASDYITTTSMEHKLNPPDAPPAMAQADSNRGFGLAIPTAPGRPSNFVITERAEKLRGLEVPRGRARAMHTFLHHELQAAELMAWAILAFPNTPPEFRDGLARIALDEARHMRMYAEQITRLGFKIGDFSVRDWFWMRVPSCRDPASFVAVMGLGLESANLEHTASFTARFKEVGDEESARVQELVGLEEIAHVRFGVRWFREFTRNKNENDNENENDLDFESWKKALPEPLTPLLMRGKPLRRDARLKAGQPVKFLDDLDAWEPEPYAPMPKSATLSDGNGDGDE